MSLNLQGGEIRLIPGHKRHAIYIQGAVYGVVYRGRGHPPAQVTLPQWFVLCGQLGILGSKHLSQELHNLQPLVVVITLQGQITGDRLDDGQLLLGRSGVG